MSRKYTPRQPKPYTNWHLFWDIVLTICTSGLWLIAIGIKFMRRNSR